MTHFAPNLRADSCSISSPLQALDTIKPQNPKLCERNCDHHYEAVTSPWNAPKINVWYTSWLVHLPDRNEWVRVISCQDLLLIIIHLYTSNIISPKTCYHSYYYLPIDSSRTRMRARLRDVAGSRPLGDVVPKTLRILPEVFTCPGLDHLEDQESPINWPNFMMFYGITL